jgi:hypothetical protein
MASAPPAHAPLPNPCKGKIERNSSYRKTCTNPVSMPDGTTPYKNQIHHILCEHAILDRKPSGDADGSKKKLIKDCLCMIDYDINEEANLIGLPMKSAYTRPGVNLPSNHCCHNVDHNTSDGYTNECKTWLHDNLWNTIVDTKKSHKANADNILETLRKCTSTFKGILTKRGKRNDGTASSWKNRFVESEWYFPFSMGSDPSKRSPGGRGKPRVLKMIE